MYPGSVLRSGHLDGAPPCLVRPSFPAPHTRTPNLLPCYTVCLFGTKRSGSRKLTPGRRPGVRADRQGIFHVILISSVPVQDRGAPNKKKTHQYLMRWILLIVSLRWY
eukprot:sb/3477565/